MLRGDKGYAPQLAGLACPTRACAPQQEKPPQRAAPVHCNQRKPVRSNEDSAQPKIKTLINFKKEFNSENTLPLYPSF